MDHILPPSPGSSPSSTSATDKPKSWADYEFSFIPIRQAHLDLMGFAYGRTTPPVEELYGNAMVDKHFMPVGFCFMWFEPCGVISVHAHFGKWLKMFPKDVLRGMKQTMDELRAMGVRYLHSSADMSIEGSRTLIEWCGGTPTKAMGEFGPIYIIDLHTMKI